MTSKLLRLAVLASLAVGCNPAPGSADKEAKPAPSDGESKPDEDAAAMGLPPMAKLFTSGLDKPGPYEEPRQSPDYEDGKPHHLVLELGGSIAELESLDLFGGGMGKPLREITNTLHTAAADPNVKGLVLRAADLSLDMATAEELRGQLLAFKGDGARTVRCHAETAVNAVY
jgi:protease IV